MPPSHSVPSGFPWKGGIRTVLFTGSLVGVVDGLAAIALTTIVSGRSPLIVFQYIASALIGPEAFSGGLPSALLGIACHFFIALTWTAVIFLAHPLVSQALKKKLAISIFYGVVIWSVMNLLVLPLTLVTQGPFTPAKILTGAGILVFAAGAPMAWSFDRFYREKVR